MTISAFPGKLFVVLLVFSSGKLAAQDDAVDFVQQERSIRNRAWTFINGRTDTARVNAANEVYARLQELLSEPGSWDHPFDSLRLATVSIVQPEDRKFRFFTWNLLLNNGTFKYFGILQYRTGKKNVELLALADTGRTHTKIPMYRELDPSEWQGALYYQAVAFKKKRKTWYLLVGYDGMDARASRKIVDVLTFKRSGDVAFGAPLFYESAANPRAQYRLVSEFADQANPALRYEAEGNILVLSHMVPVRPELTDDRSWYVPDGTYDHYKPDKKGRWINRGELKDFRFMGGERGVPQEIPKH